MRKILLAMMLLFVSSISTAVDTCVDAEIFTDKMFTGVCWDCPFPMRMFGLTMGPGEVPSGAADASSLIDGACICTGLGGAPELGVLHGSFHPSRMVEIVRQSYCSPSLGGVKISNSYLNNGHGPEENEPGELGRAFYHYHYFAFPLYAILELLNVVDCSEDGFTDVDLMYLSELDPTWNDPDMARLLVPETDLFANPLAVVQMTVDCVASTLGRPINEIYWSAGCWGHLYPFSGDESEDSRVEGTSLLATRALAALHRRGLAKSTIGIDAACGATYFPTIQKSMYQMSMLFPFPEANSGTVNLNNNSADGDTGDGNGNTNGEGDAAAASEAGTPLDATDLKQDKCCHAVGTESFAWGEWRTAPYKGEDFVYQIWKWQDCCMR